MHVVRPGFAVLLLGALTFALATEIAAATGKVSIANFAFGPAAEAIQVGDTLIWSNDDGAAHTVTFKDGSEGAKSLSPGQSFSRAFEKAGTYDYFCSFHPYMTGKVTVGAQ